MTLSELLAQELAVYYLFLALLLIGFLFTSDSIAAVPIACCAYMTLAPQNHPTKHPTTSVFASQAFCIQFAFILVMAVLLAVVKLIIMLIAGRGRLPLPKFLGGFVFLGISYVIGGAFTPHWGFRTALFGFVSFIALAGLYTYFAVTVDWRQVKKTYFPMLFLIIGVGMCMEIADMYTLPGVFVNGVVDRTALFTGWGVYNNVACVMTMCIPAPCYFAVTRKNGWVFTLIMVLFLLATVLTQSRGGILFGCILALICTLYILFCSKGVAKQRHLLVYIAFACLLLAVTLAVPETISALFDSLEKIGMDSNNRWEIYGACWDAFRSSPWFGVGFYDTPGYTIDSLFMPPRAHNTYLQLLSSGGITSFIAYFFHRMETLLLIFIRPTHEKVFVGLSALALILTSLVDCNFFNFGPTILYGILFAFLEGFERVTREDRYSPDRRVDSPLTRESFSLW